MKISSIVILRKARTGRKIFALAHDLDIWTVGYWNSFRSSLIRFQTLSILLIACQVFSGCASNRDWVWKPLGQEQPLLAEMPNRRAAIELEKCHSTPIWGTRECRVAIGSLNGSVVETAEVRRLTDSILKELSRKSVWTRTNLAYTYQNVKGIRLPFRLFLVSIEPSVIVAVPLDAISDQVNPLNEDAKSYCRSKRCIPSIGDQPIFWEIELVGEIPWTPGASWFSVDYPGLGMQPIVFSDKQMIVNSRSIQGVFAQVDGMIVYKRN
jgi:hypothetical protein